MDSFYLFLYSFSQKSVTGFFEIFSGFIKFIFKYGVDWKELRKDSQLNAYLSDFCHSAARRLDANRMIRYDPM